MPTGDSRRKVRASRSVLRGHAQQQLAYLRTAGFEKPWSWLQFGEQWLPHVLATEYHQIRSSCIAAPCCQHVPMHSRTADFEDTDAGMRSYCRRNPELQYPSTKAHEIQTVSIEVGGEQSVLLFFPRCRHIRCGTLRTAFPILLVHYVSLSLRTLLPQQLWCTPHLPLENSRHGHLDSFLVLSSPPVLLTLKQMLKNLSAGPSGTRRSLPNQLAPENAPESVDIWSRPQQSQQPKISSPIYIDQERFASASSRSFAIFSPALLRPEQLPRSLL